MSRPPRAADPAATAPRERRSDAEATEPRSIVICEECGRKYSVSPSKIQGSAAGFTCRHCGHRIVVAKTEGEGTERIQALGGPFEEGVAAVEPGATHPAPRAAASVFPLLAWGVITTVAIAGAVGLFILRLHAELADFERQNLQASRQLAEQHIDRIASALAERVRLILAAQPGLAPGDFASNPELRAIAMQPVGTTGQSLVAAMPDTDGVWRVWLHPDPRRVGADLGSIVSDADPLFPDVWKSINRAAYGTPSVGVHRVRGTDGVFRGQAMACYPVTGTTYILAAAAPVEELAAPLVRMQSRAAEVVRELGGTAAYLLGGTILAAAGAALLVVRRRARSRPSPR